MPSDSSPLAARRGHAFPSALRSRLPAGGRTPLTCSAMATGSVDRHSATALEAPSNRTNSNLTCEDAAATRSLTGARPPVDTFGNGADPRIRKGGVVRELLTIEEVAERLRAKVLTMRRLHQEGGLPPANQGGPPARLGRRRPRGLAGDPARAGENATSMPSGSFAARRCATARR